MSNHRNPNIPTALCPWCDEYFALTAHGAFRQHRGRLIGKGGKTHTGPDMCDATGLTPEEAEQEAR